MSLADRVEWPEVIPASRIKSWGEWPEDVVETLKLWNHQKFGTGWRLSFAGGFSMFNRPRVFKCYECQWFHEYPQGGVAIFEDNRWCDPCLIERARNEPSPD